MANTRSQQRKRESALLEFANPKNNYEIIDLDYYWGMTPEITDTAVVPVYYGSNSVSANSVEHLIEDCEKGVASSSLKRRSSHFQDDSAVPQYNESRPSTPPMLLITNPKDEISEGEVGPSGEISTCLDLDYEDFIHTWGQKISGLEVAPSSAICFPFSGEPLIIAHIISLRCESGSPSPAADATTTLSGDNMFNRVARLERYKEKRRNRQFSKKIRYTVRKLNAERRPRVKGRFVKQGEVMDDEADRDESPEQDCQDSDME